jgi:DNA-binding MarR family transcriptional regulator
MDPSPGPAVETTASEVKSVTEVDRVLHEPARLLIAATLYPLDSADFLYLARETALTKGNLSSHLARLEGAGYIEIEKTYRGKVPLTLCRLTDAGRTALGAYRDQMRRVVAGLTGTGA